MRAPRLIFLALLALAACKNNDAVDNSQNVGQNLTAENIVSNDVTAIDAVTGDAANMAADADVNDLGNISNETANVSAFPKAKPETVTASGSSSTSKPAPRPVTNTPVTNTAANAVSNGE